MINEHEYRIFDPREIPREEISDTTMLVKDPMVSVRMVTYNHAPYISQAIDGVLRQETDYPYELIIGEDCSTDATRKIVLQYQKKHPHVIRVITSACNVGAKRNNWRVGQACRGRYVALCDGDDYWHHPQKLQKQVDYLEAHPEVGLVHSAVRILSSEGHAISIKRDDNNYIRSVLDYKKDLFREMMLGRYQLSTVTVCARRDLLISIKQSDPEVYLSNRFILGDLPMWLDLSRRTSFHYIDEALASYRMLRESASRSEEPEKVKAYQLSAIDLRLYYLDKYPPGNRVRGQILRYLAKRLLRSGFALNDYEMVYRGKKLSNKVGIEGLVLYYAVANRYLRSVFLSLQYMTNRRWFGCGFLKAAH